jgi:hypothetical protein
VQVARELIGVPKRRHLAAALDRVLRAAAARPHPWRTAVPLNRREVVAAREELAALAERLRAGRARARARRGAGGGARR